VFFSVANLGEVGTDRTTMPPCPHSRTNDTSEHAVLVRGAVSAPEMSLDRVRHVFQGTTSALVYGYFLGKRDMARACPPVPLDRQGCPTAYVTEELKAIRIFALSTGGTGLSEKAPLDSYNSVAQAETVTAATTEAVISQLDNELRTSSDYSSRSSRSSSCDTKGTSSSSKRSRRTKRESLRKRVRKSIADAKARAKGVKDPLISSFRRAAAFVASFKGERERCLSEKKMQVTQIVDGVSLDFFFREHHGRGP